MAVDIGGTFTDAVAFDEDSGQIFLGKASTTPAARVEGILAAVADTGHRVDESHLLIHGSTTVINALLERKGARTALVTTQGFRDVYEIGRINRPQSFNLFFEKHRPLVPRRWRLEVPERMTAEGDIHRPLDEMAAHRVGQQLALWNIEAVAVVLLHAYRNPVHELRVQAILRQHLPHAFIGCSHELSREYREFERTSTTVANAFVGPVVRQYLDDLEVQLQHARFRGQVAIMQSNGGLCQLSVARQQCVQMLESGPAGGVTGIQKLCQVLGQTEAIAFDMGGTTAKACVILDGQPRLAEDYFVGGYAEGLPIRIPVLEITEVGTGGGSIARLGPGGGLRVGPDSAGAVPGPVAYGYGGTWPTVTDANLLLGRIDPHNFLGGRLPLYPDRAWAALRDRIAQPLDLGWEVAAEGILRIAVAQMGHAVRAVTTAKGLDPRDFAMVAYGGAGPLHAVALAQELFIPTVIIPPMPSVFSALGMLLADFRVDLLETHMAPLQTVDPQWLTRQFAALTGQAVAQVQAAGIAASSIQTALACDMRYMGQEHTVTVPWPAASDPGFGQVKAHFDQLHEARYSHSARDVPAEIVNLRVTAVGELAKPVFPAMAIGGQSPPGEACRGTRAVFDRGQSWQTAIYVRERLQARNCIEGPAIIEEPTSATFLPEGCRLTVGDFGELRIEVNRRDVP